MRYDYLVLELAILGLLGDGPLHGYEIRRRLRAQMGLVANISFGSLYPALARLEAAGDLIALEGETEAAILPSTGSLSGERAALKARRLVGTRSRRSKKVYRITDKGAAHFAALLVRSAPDPAPPRPEFWKYVSGVGLGRGHRWWSLQAPFQSFERTSNALQNLRNGLNVWLRHRRAKKVNQCKPV